MNYTKTSQFILPLVIWDGSFTTLLNSGFINSFCGHIKESEKDWGKHIYLLFDKVPKDLMDNLSSNNELKDVIYENDKVLLKFRLKELDYLKVALPFIRGKYSEIDANFREKNHSRKIFIDGKTIDNPTYLAMIKSDILRQRVEKMIGQELPEGAEVYSRPEMDEEIFSPTKLSSHDIENPKQSGHKGHRIRNVQVPKSGSTKTTGI